MTMSREGCPEMPADGADSRLEHLMGDLERMGEASRASSLPARSDLRIMHALQEQAARFSSGSRPTKSARFVFRRRYSLTFVVLAMLGTAMLGGATYAAVPVLSRVFHLGGADTVIQQHLGREVNLSQRLGGYTMTIKRVYVDPNRVLIAYSIRPPRAGRRLWNMSTNLTVTNEQGTVLPERSLVGDVDPTEPETTLQGFDAATITGHLRGVGLHLTVPWIEAMEQLHAPPGPGQSSGQEFPGLPPAGAFGSVAIARPVGEQDPWMQIVRTYGPISFDVTVPFVQGREVRPQQQIQAGGVTATLARVVISPTETRLYVSGPEPNTFGILSTADGESSDAATQWRWHGMTVYSFFTDLMEKHGDWTLVVKPMPPLRLPPGVTTPPGSTPAKGGPWIFRFIVP